MRQHVPNVPAQEVISGGFYVVLRLLPVLILYLTAALDDSGKARFYRDIYQRDAAVLEALDGPVTDLNEGARWNAAPSIDTGQLLN